MGYCDMAFPTGWARKCKITIPDAQISGSNANYPVLLTAVNFPTEMLDGGLFSALNGGGDVRFSTDSAGAVQCACEIVSCITGGTPDAEIWVKLPTLDTGAAKDFYVWYNKAGETQAAVTDPFGRNAVWSDYEAVYHLNSNVSLLDATGNQVAPTISGSPTSPVSGPYGWGQAIDFDGVDDEINVGGFGFFDTTGDAPATMQAIVRPDVVDANRAVMGELNSGNYGYVILLDNSGAYSGNTNIVTSVWSMSGATLTRIETATNSILPATAYVLHLTRDITVAQSLGAIQYIDGVNAGVKDRGSSIENGIGGDIKIGNSDGFGTFFDGLIQEVRFRRSTLSPDWITTETNNFTDPAAFASAGTPESVGAGATLILQEAFHGVTSDALVLTQTHSLSLGRATHSQTADNLVLGQSQSLTVNDGLHGLASDQTALSQLQALVIQIATHGLMSDETGIYDPAAYTPNPQRTGKAQGPSRTSSAAVGDWTTRPSNNRTLRI